MRLKSLFAVAAFAIPAVVSAATPIAIYRDPGCGCCEKWAAQVQARFGRGVQIFDSRSRGDIHKKFGVPADLVSCHTAVVDGMVFEGHVPIADMKRALAQHPRGVAGLAVAGMPMGSPGMEMEGMKGEAYDVVAFGPGGRRVFAHHN